MQTTLYYEVGNWHLDTGKIAIKRLIKDYENFKIGDTVYIKRIDIDKECTESAVTRRMTAKIVKIKKPHFSFFGDFRGNLTLQLANGRIVELEKRDYKDKYILSPEILEELEKTPMLGFVAFRGGSQVEVTWQDI